jgi:3-dehydroquinate dehydratase-2
MHRVPIGITAGSEYGSELGPVQLSQIPRDHDIRRDPYPADPTPEDLLLSDIQHSQAMTPSILILNGPNLNLLGSREPEIYGAETLDSIQARVKSRAGELALKADFRQSNAEHELVGWIQEARDTAQGIILNAGAFTHTSVSILDALQAVGLPVIEVHLSNIYRREHFRQRSYISRVAEGTITGFGGEGYVLAIEAMAHLLEKVDKSE